MVGNKTRFSLIALILVVSTATVFVLYKKFSSDEWSKKIIEIEVVNKENSVFDKKVADKSDEVAAMEKDVSQLEVKGAEDEALEEESARIIIEEASVVPTVLPTPAIQRNNPNELRVGFITDLHARSDINAMGDRVLETSISKRLNYFVEKMNNDFVPNFILVNGDVIEGSDVSAEVGMEELSLAKDIFDRTVLEKHWVVGNHDLRSVRKKQFEQSLGIDDTNKAFKVGNYKIIILDSNFTKEDKNVAPGRSYVRGYASEDQIEFLKKELDTNKRVVVFMHHPPLWDVDFKANSGLPYNAEELQAIFSQHGVLAVFAGHIEDLFLKEIGGVKYFVSPGVAKNKKYQGAFSEVTFKKSNMIIEMNYLKNDGSNQTVRIKGD